MNEEELQKAQEFAQKRLIAFTSQREKVNPYAFKLGYDAGAKEILDNPELYGLVKKDVYDTLEEFYTDLTDEL